MTHRPLLAFLVALLVSLIVSGPPNDHLTAQGTSPHRVHLPFVVSSRPARTYLGGSLRWHCYR